MGRAGTSCACDHLGALWTRVTGGQHRRVRLPRRFEKFYRDGRAHRLGRGFLGFGEVETRDADTGIELRDAWSPTRARPFRRLRVHWDDVRIRLRVMP
jgi:hypothetical protein